MKTAREILLNHIPKDCWWEDAENLTNTPILFVLSAMDEWAVQMSIGLKTRIAQLEDILHNFVDLPESIKMINVSGEYKNSINEFYKELAESAIDSMTQEQVVESVLLVLYREIWEDYIELRKLRDTQGYDKKRLEGYMDCITDLRLSIEKLTGNKLTSKNL